MATTKFASCPHCNAGLSYLAGVPGSTMTPECPRCHVVITVTRATFLMMDHSHPAAKPTRAHVPSATSTRHTDA